MSVGCTMAMGDTIITLLMIIVTLLLKDILLPSLFIYLDYKMREETKSLAR